MAPTIHKPDWVTTHWFSQHMEHRNRKMQWLPVLKREILVTQDREIETKTMNLTSKLWVCTDGQAVTKANQVFCRSGALKQILYEYKTNVITSVPHTAFADRRNNIIRTWQSAVGGNEREHKITT
jgi:hypothetical protein